MANVLVIAEHDGAELKDATLNTVTAGSRIGDVDVLVAGEGVGAVAEAAAKIAGVGKVLVADNVAYANLIPEDTATLIAGLAENYDAVLSAASTSGKNYMPRVAALLDVAQISEVVEVVSEDTFVRPIYAGNAMAKVQSTDAKKIITVRSTGFEKAAAEGGSAAIENVDAAATAGISEFVSHAASDSDRPELTTARVIISGGRGMQSGENFELLEKVADKLGAAIGASRAAVDSGFVPSDMQVGQTGKIVAPELYIAVGISGAIQHLAGMKDSKVIVAINKDPEAPIFEVADYGLVADLFTAMPELEAAL